MHFSTLPSASLLLTLSVLFILFQEIAEMIAADMQKHGVHMIRGAVPTKFEKKGEQTAVTYKNMDFGFENTETYDTV